MKIISQNEAKRFWKQNLKVIHILLVIWFAVSYGIVILFGDVLNSIPFMGTSLPFWFGQQGSILIFLGLLIIYAAAMDRISNAIEEIHPVTEKLWKEKAEVLV